MKNFNLFDFKAASQLVLQALLISFALLLALWKPKLGDSWFRKVERWFAGIARRRRLAIFIVLIFAFTINAAMSLFVQMPQPVGQDEFTYLLISDTFAHGRLANSSHPLWQHFETFNVLVQPTYAGRFPPAQGLALAVGQITTGLPIAGAWLSVAVACAAVCWMMMAWLPARWAFTGALVVSVHPMVINWGQIYWGGAMSMIGGALLLGAFRRIVQHPTVQTARVRDAWLMGAGLLILANSRPFEGMILSLLVGISWLVLLIRRRELGTRAFVVRIGAPLAVMLVITAFTIGYYNLHVTGNALKLPHILYGEIYDPVPHFFWQRPRPLRTYLHATLPNYFLGYQMVVYESQNSFGKLPFTIVRKALFLAANYFQHLALALGLLALPCVVRRNRWMQFAAAVSVLFFFMAIVPVVYSQHHFFAPVLGLFFVLEIQALRHLRLWRFGGKPVGRFIVRAILLLCVAALVLKAARQTKLAGENAPAYTRAAIVKELGRSDERHLIIVRYTPNYAGYFEYVYNAADIDSSKIVWAREMNSEKNRELLEYFKDRRVWLLEAEAETLKLAPYSAHP